MGKLSKWLTPYIDIQTLRKTMHHWVLLGVSIYVFMQMERQLDIFSRQIKTSVSEREYNNQQSYKQIMSQLKSYDGEMVPLDTSEELPTYKHELVGNS